MKNTSVFIRTNRSNFSRTWLGLAWACLVLGLSLAVRAASSLDAPDGSPLNALTIDNAGNTVLANGAKLRLGVNQVNDNVGGTVSLELAARSTGGGENRWNLYTSAVGDHSGVVPNSFSIWQYPGGTSNGICCLERFTIAPTPKGQNTSRLLLDGAGRLGLNVATPLELLDVNGRVRIRGASSGLGTAGIWFHDNPSGVGVGFVGLYDTAHVGFFGSGAGWGMTMDTGNGRVGIGTLNPTARLDVNGNIAANTIDVRGADVAEAFDINGPILPGMVVRADPDHDGKLIATAAAYDPTIIGVVSGAGGIHPGQTLRQPGTVADGSQPVAMLGRVYVLVDASNGPIRPGDSLVSSSVPGHAMRSSDAARGVGATLGTALGSFSEGRGLVLVAIQRR